MREHWGWAASQYHRDQVREGGRDPPPGWGGLPGDEEFEFGLLKYKRVGKKVFLFVCLNNRWIHVHLHLKCVGQLQAA